MSTNKSADDESRAPSERDLDLESLKALAHPLRVRIIDTLSTYGSFTASGLAERLGESSGATSYHLRQLEKHGFVREVVDRGTGRERWWERVPVGFSFATKTSASGAAGRAAANLVYQQTQDNQRALLDDFIENGDAKLDEEWVDASVVSSASTRLTIDQARKLATAWSRLYDEFVAKYRSQQVPGARPIHVQFAAFPVVDGTVVADDSATESD